MQYRVLGPLEVVAGGGELVRVRAGHPRTLLIALLLRAGDTVGSDHLADLLWGDDLPANPANALQSQVAYLRRTLRPYVEGDGPLVTRPGGYSLEVADDVVDARRFVDAVADASTRLAGGDPDQVRAAAGALEEALGWWRGEALADVVDVPALRGEVERFAELRLTAVELQLEAGLALGRHRELVGELLRLVGEHPLRERFAELAVLALYRCGRQAEALRVVADARARLTEELGLLPGPALQELERAVLDQDATLDLAREAGPAPATVAAVPVPVTPLVGREHDLERATERLTATRLLTLTGPGGSGKTRLAVELAQRWDPGSTWFVPLSEVVGAELVAPTVAHALGLTTTPDADPVVAVAAALATERGLLVLDTCEHVLEGVVALVGPLVRAAPDVTVLATSRRPLGMAGETTHVVPPLALPEPEDAVDEAGDRPAVALFCDRATARRADFALTGDNVGAVVDICRRLDGLPLAIELAAAWADVLSPHAVADRLKDRFELLTSGAADAEPRQQTLRRTLDWTYDLLAPDEQRCFARLGVFPGSFDLEAAIAISGEDLATLSSLVRSSMVTVDGDDRYRLLDSMRAYALDQLAPDLHEELRRRHAEHVLAVVEDQAPRIQGSEQAEWLRRLRADVPNHRAALVWAEERGPDGAVLLARLTGALSWFWMLEGRLAEAITNLERAAAHEDLPPAVRALVLWGLANVAASYGQLERARAAGQASTAAARDAADDAAIGRGLNTTAVACWALGDHEASAAAHDEGIERFAAAGDGWGLAVSKALRARTALDTGDPDGPGRAREAVVDARATGDGHVLGIALSQVVRVEVAAGDLDAALAAAEEAAAAHEAGGFAEGQVAALHLQARVHALAGRPVHAWGLHREALRRARAIHHLAAQCEALESLARLAAESGHRDEARRLLFVADRERTAHGLARQAEDEAEVRALLDELGPPPPGAPEAAVPLDHLVAELLD